MLTIICKTNAGMCLRNVCTFILSILQVQGSYSFNHFLEGQYANVNEIVSNIKKLKPSRFQTNPTILK